MQTESMAQSLHTNTNTRTQIHTQFVSSMCDAYTENGAYPLKFWTPIPQYARTIVCRLWIKEKSHWKWSLFHSRAPIALWLCDLCLCLSVTVLDYYVLSKIQRRRKKSPQREPNRTTLAPCFYRITQTLLKLW